MKGFRAAAFAAMAVLGATHALAQPQHLRVGIADDADALDPHLSRAFVATGILMALCDRLVALDREQNFIPQLATQWTWSPDNLALNLTLRQGVTFHDGTPFDAEAVKFNIERAMTIPESQRRDDSAHIAGVEVTGPFAITVRMRQPDVTLLSKFAERLGMMMSPTAARAAGTNFARNPVCAGPYRFVERVAQDRIVLERFPGYWEQGAFHLDRVTYRVITDGTVRLANLQAGGLDLIERIEATDAPRVEANRALRLRVVDTLGYQSIVVNVANTPRGNHPMGRDARVREAFDLALDRRAIVEVAFGGRFAAGNQFVVPGSPFYNPAIPIPARNPDRARQLLREAGHTRPVPFEITVPNRPAAVRVAEIIQAMTNEVGFDTRLRVVEFATSLNLTDAGDFQAWGPIGPQTANDPDAVTYMSLHSRGSRNVGKYSSPEMDRVMDAQRAEPDPARRRALFHEAARIMSQDRALIYLFHPRFIFGHSARVTGFEPLGDGYIFLRGVRIAAN